MKFPGSREDTLALAGACCTVPSNPLNLRISLDMRHLRETNTAEDSAGEPHDSMAQPQSRLLALPTELQICITHHLDHGSAACFAMACKHLPCMTAPRSHRAPRLGLLICENLNKENDKDRQRQGGRYACFQCSQLKFRLRFGRKQTTRARWKNLNLPGATKRFCIMYGLSKKISLSLWGITVKCLDDSELRSYRDF